MILAGPVLHGRVFVSYHANNYRDRIGWKEIVVGATAPSRSDELRAYPKDLLQSPLDITRVTTSFGPGPGPATPPQLTRGHALQAPDRIADSGFAALVARRHLSALVLLASLAAALFWGAAHALSPGHGKTIVTAYLVGRRGTPGHAALLGLIVTATVDKRGMTYLYREGTDFVFMDSATYDQVHVPAATVGDGANYLLDNADAVVAVHDGTPLYVELPTSVELVISHTDPGVQGDRSTGGTKPATLETGAEIQVPLFVSTGEKVKVDTRDGRYLGRVSG